ncbi:MAG: hypothetical protein M3270_09665 [Thermoproteota archaeon]|nr:hypothetical protein [Thermoproteota archaeon]
MKRIGLKQTLTVESNYDFYEGIQRNREVSNNDCQLKKLNAPLSKIKDKVVDLQTHLLF